MEYFVTAGHTLSVEADRERIRLGLQHFYYDVALSAHDAVFALLRDTIGFDRVLFGSDYPQVPESFVMAAATTLTDSCVMDGPTRSQLARTNGLNLIQRFGAGGPGE
jgi:predicted TIM-barrel fold metal-dependent hydrolase